MKSLKEIAQNIIPLSEGVFDMEGDDRLGKSVEKDTTAMFLKTCKGDFKSVFFKDGSVRITGKLIISGIETDKIYLNCREFKGKLIIENCPKLTTLEGSFLEKHVVFDGSLTINQCPELVSLKGIPELVKGDVSITNCKKLKDVGALESVFGSLYWQHNGKKFTPEQLAEKVHVIRKIFCSADDMDADVNESILTEAFNNPWLQRLAAQLKKYPYKSYSWDKDGPDLYNTVDSLFKKYGRVTTPGGRLLDKITNTDVDVYDMGDEKDKKDLAKVFYDTYNSNDTRAGDIILIYKEDIGEFVGFFGNIAKVRGQQNSGVNFIVLPNKDGIGVKGNAVLTSWFSKTDAKAKLLSYGIGYTAVVINSGYRGKDSQEKDGTSSDDRWEIQKDRSISREGMINPGDVEQYKAIATANLKRYKDKLAQIRLARKKNDEAGGYDKLIDEYEKINLRVIKFVRAIAKDPKSFKRYEVDLFLKWIRDRKEYNRRYTWNGKNGPQYYGEDGLAYYFNSFMSAYMKCFGDGNYKDNPDSSDYKDLENASNAFKTALAEADQKLKKFGF